MASEGGLPTLSGFPEVPGFTIGGIEVSDEGSLEFPKIGKRMVKIVRLNFINYS